MMVQIMKRIIHVLKMEMRMGITSNNTHNGNYIKTDKKNNTQVIRLTFGGKRLYTKEYHLSTNQKGALIIKEKDL